MALKGKRSANCSVTGVGLLDLCNQDEGLIAIWLGESELPVNHPIRSCKVFNKMW
jgi:hypothetical protein